MAQDKSLEGYQAAEQAEWFTYVARAAIDLDGVRAFNKDDPVPVSHVTRGVVRLDQVRPMAEVLPETTEIAKLMPAGANIQPDKKDIEAARKANLEAGVKE